MRGWGIGVRVGKGSESGRGTTWGGRRTCEFRETEFNLVHGKHMMCALLW